MSVFWHPRGCVLDLEFAELSGNKVYDLSGNGNHGTIYGAKWKKGPLLGALEFDGVDDYVESNTSVGNWGTGDWSVEAWVKAELLSSYQAIVSKTHRIGDGGWNVVLEANTNKVRFRIDDADITFPNSPQITQNHIVVVFDRDGFATLWVDGEKKDEYDISSYASYNHTNSLNLTVGRAANFEGDLYKGDIALVRIYNRALTEAEIKAHYRYLMKYTPQRRLIPKVV